MDGFVTGLAVFVAVGQLNKLFGVSSGSGNTFKKSGTSSGSCRRRTAGPSRWASGRSPCSMLLPADRWPGAGRPRRSVRRIAVGAALDLETAHGVDVVGSLPEGLPTPSFPDIPLSTWVALVPAAIGIVLVAYSEALGVAREFAAHHGYEIDPDRS